MIYLEFMEVQDLLSKESFCKRLDSIRRAWDTDTMVSKLARGYGVDDVSVNTSFLMIDVIELLEVLMRDQSSGWIWYFVSDLDFGRSFKPGKVVDKGKSVDLSTAEKLYDFLAARYSVAGKKG